MPNVSSKSSLVLLSAAALTAGCQPSSSESASATLRQWVGKQVEVHFRRDALGAAASVPVPAMSSNHNGAQLSTMGTLVRADARSLTITSGSREFWIPLDAVLHVDGATSGDQ